MNRTEVVAVFEDRLPGELARSMLADAGIDATVLADDLGGLHPELSRLSGGVRLVVTPTDAAYARELLAEDHSASLADAMLEDEHATDVRTRPLDDREGSGPRPRRGRLVLVSVLLVLLLLTFVLVDTGQRAGWWSL